MPFIPNTNTSELNGLIDIPLHDFENIHEQNNIEKNRAADKNIYVTLLVSNMGHRKNS